MNNSLNKLVLMAFLGLLPSFANAMGVHNQVRLQAQWMFLIPSLVSESFALNQFEVNEKVGYTISHAVGGRQIKNQVITHKMTQDLLQEIAAVKRNRGPASYCQNPTLLRETQGKDVRTYQFCTGSPQRNTALQKLILNLKLR